MNAIPYDFTKPGRLSTEWTHRLTAWYRAGLSQTNKAWGRLLPVPLEVSLRDVDSCFAHTLSQLPDGMTGYRMSAANGSVPTLLVLPRTLLLHFVGALLNDRENGAADREMSSVEDSLADYFFVNCWLPFFRDTWPAPELVSWELQAREPEVQCSRCFAPADVLMSLGLQVVGPWGTAEATWFFHQEKLLSALGDSRVRGDVVSEAMLASRRAATVHSLPMEVEIVLGTAEVKLSQLSRLQVGDVVLLDQRDDDAIIGRTGNRVLFHGQAGRVGSMMAIRIASAIGQ